MEYDNLDQIAEHARGRVEDQANKAAGPSPIQSQVGNRAFSQLVDRSAIRSQGAGPLDPEIGGEIQAARGGGAQLDDSTRADMEGHLGVDLSAVRVHTDSNADALSRSVQAEAFTTGTDVFFKSGNYSPGSTDGRRLLAHELTHVVQQSTGTAGGGGEVSHPDDPHEVEAKAVGDEVAASAPVTDRSAVHREESLEEEEPDVEVDRSAQGVFREEEGVEDEEDESDVMM